MFGKKQYVYVPQTDDTVSAYSALLDVLKSSELRDYLRQRLTAKGNELPRVVAENNATRTAMLAGEISAYQYLLGEAITKIEKMLEIKKDTTNIVDNRMKYAVRDDEEIFDKVNS